MKFCADVRFCAFHITMPSLLKYKFKWFAIFFAVLDLMDKFFLTFFIFPILRLLFAFHKHNPHFFFILADNKAFFCPRHREKFPHVFFPVRLMFFPLKNETVKNSLLKMLYKYFSPHSNSCKLLLKIFIVTIFHAFVNEKLWR